MLSSLNSCEKGEEEHHHHSSSYQLINIQNDLLPSPTQYKQLLITSAELIHRGDIPAACRALSFLSRAVSPYGDCTDRVVHQFTKALSLSINNNTNQHFVPPIASEALQSSYLSFNKITPFLRFSHLTANQAILEAIEGHNQVHILDFDTSHGVQWPPLLQAIAERSNPKDPTFIRITGTGDDLQMLHRTGDRLGTFAQSLGLKFQFHPLYLPSSFANFNPNYVQIQPGETLAVNCVLFLHKLFREASNANESMQDLMSFLQTIRSMNPAVVTVAEREARHNSPVFLQRFIEALDYYTVIFETLEATLPPSSRERLAVEQVWLGREIEDVVGLNRQGEERRERHEPFERWEGIMRAAEFTQTTLSTFALSQAKLLLRLHYPTEGYQLQMVRDAIFLGWHSKPLFSVSSWH